MSKRTLPTDACVYVIGTADGPQKIGMTIKPIKRLMELQLATHAVLVLHQTTSMTRIDAGFVEAHAHWLLQAKSVRGEWFMVTPDEAMQAVKEAIEAVRKGTTVSPKWRVSRTGGGGRGGGRRPIGDRAMTNAEKKQRSRAMQAVAQQAREAEREAWRAAFEQLTTVKTAAAARKIASEALAS